MRNLSRILLRIPVPWVFILAYLLGVGLELAFPIVKHKTGMGSIGIAGGVIFIVGAVIAGWGLIIFHRARTTTVPGKVSAKFVTYGPYRMTRNPMYVGLVLAYIGEAGILKQVWPLIFLPLVVFYVNSIVIPLEEARLEETFGEEYQRYRDQVRRWI